MYLFYLGGILLPVTPSAFTLKDKNQNRTVGLVSGGEISLPETCGLCEISFSALLPMARYPFSVYEGGFKDGMYFAGALRGFKEKAEPIWFRVLRYGRRASTDIYCVIEEIGFKEDALNGGDITCNIVLKQYRDYTAKIVDTASGTVIGSGGSKAAAPESVKVKRGDTLWTIAKRYYGDGSKHTDIYAKNKDTIEAAALSHGLTCSESGRYIFEGEELKL